MRLPILALTLALHGATAAADEVTICYNYGCAAQASVMFSKNQMSSISKLFTRLPDAQAERQAISRAIGLFETYAGEQTPTHRDRGGNSEDDGVDGRMDCIDHSNNSTAYLNLLEKRHLLKFHRVLAPVRRAPYLVNDHWAAHLEETDTQREFAVDSWFFDNGRPAAIIDLSDWLKGAEPDA